MTICKFYSNGFCRYGNKCRFEHIDSTNKDNYYYENNNRKQQQSQQYPQQYSQQYSQQYQYKGNRREPEPRIGFSFNRTLENIDSNERFKTNNNYEYNRPMTRSFTQQISQQMPYNERSNTNAFSGSSLTRSVFQSPINRENNSKVGGFSFNRALQEVNNDNSLGLRSTNRSMIDDIEMDSNSNLRIRRNSLSREPQSNSFGHFSQPNSGSSIFGNKSSNVETVIPKVSSSHNIYSKPSDLTPNDIKQYESQQFTFKCIPIRAPTQQLCF